MTVRGTLAHGRHESENRRAWQMSGRTGMAACGGGKQNGAVDETG